MRILGLMSGTSMDAVDQAVVDFGEPRDGELEATLVWHGSHPWGDAERARLLAMLPPASTSVCEVDWAQVAVGECFAAAARQARDVAGPLDLVVSHGQTLHHWVQDGRTRGSLQVGNPAIIAEATGVPVLSDLRSADIAAGGHGAPLVPVLDQLLFGDRPSAVVNLGGIANASVVGVPRPVAGDTGPANCLLDAYSGRVTGVPCDVDGRLAGGGSVDHRLLDRLLAHPWLELPMPRSTGREVFHLGWLDEQLTGLTVSDADVMATLVEFSARTLADQLQPFRVQRTIVSGGGVHNPVLMARLRDLLPAVVTADELGLPGDAKEAVWCALTGWLSWHGLPGVVMAPAGCADASPITGARGGRVLGTLVPSPVTGWPALPASVAMPERLRLVDATASGGTPGRSTGAATSPHTSVKVKEER